MAEVNVWVWATPCSWWWGDSSLSVSIFRHCWRGCHFPWPAAVVSWSLVKDQPFVLVSCMCARQHTLLPWTWEETLLWLEGQIGQKIAGHLLLAWRPVSSVLSFCCTSMGDGKQAPCCSKQWPSWLLGKAAASTQSMQVHWGVFVPGEPGSQKRWGPAGNMFSFPDVSWSVIPDRKCLFSTWKLWTLLFFFSFFFFFLWNTVFCRHFSIEILIYWNKIFHQK